MMNLKRKVPKVVVIGLDGATWNLIKPWIDEGKLPIITKLLQNGVWGVLKSVIPISTYPSWKCYSTGKNPGKLGACFWFMFDRRTKKIKMVNSRSFKAKEIWDYLSNYGYKCGVINMPTTYPPKKINGFIIAGFNALDHLEYTYPKKLKKVLAKEYNYKINPTYALRLNLKLKIEDALREREKGLSEIKELIKTRFKVARNLLKQDHVDFFHLTIFYIDNVQHYMWGPMAENDPKYGKILEDFWTMIDEEIGKLINLLDENTYVVIMSDHGFSKLKAKFKFNVWLLTKGYLYLKKSKKSFSISSILYIFGINTQRALKISQSWLGKFITKIIPHSVLTKMWFWLRSSKDEINVVDTLDLVDWSETKAIMVGESLIYINLPKKSQEYEEFRDKLIVEINKIKNPRTGEKIATAYKVEEIYSGPYVDELPDVLVLQNEGYSLDISISKDKQLWKYDFEDGYTAFHAIDGMWIVTGPDIKKGIRLNANIYDLAPTILYIFGIQPPKDIDGDVLLEIFESEQRHGTLDFTLSIQEKNRIKTKIKELKLHKIKARR